LQVVNSAFFRLAKPIYRIKDAIVYLGQGCIYTLVMTAEVFSQWNHASIIPGLSPELLQAHAQKTAAACRALARNTPLADDALMAGLLHDIGYWVLLQECPAELKQALELAQSQSMSSSEAERQIIGATHGEIGAYLLGLWGLPYPLIEAVAFHHAPRSVAQTELDLLGILAIAHAILATLTEPTLCATDENLPGVDSDYFTQLQPAFDWEEATRRVELSLKEFEQ
jgi:HD-like signal output (HDOD) protein